MLNCYIKNTPSLSKIILNYGKKYLQNIDHLAIRTFEPEKMDKIFRQQKYKKMDDLYFFPQHKACATWYKTNSEIPRIFMSSYLGAHYDVFDVEKIQKYRYEGLKYGDYLELQKKNQYLAWTLLFPNKVNHLAFTVENLHQFCDVLEKDNFLLNNRGNPIQISKDGLLKQASIVADKVDYQFLDGLYKVPYGFVEFVERYRDGFEQENAHKIFDSTKA